MVDVTVTEVGTKQIGVTVAAERITLSRTLDYLVRLGMTGAPSGLTVDSVWPDQVDDENTTAFILIGSGFLDLGPTDLLYVVRDDQPGYPNQIPYTVISDIDLATDPGIVQVMLTYGPAPFSMHFEIRRNLGAGPVIPSPTVQVAVASAIPTLTGVAPPATYDDGQVWVLTGTHLDLVTQVTAHVDSLLGYISVPFVIDNPGQITVPAGTVAGLINIGAVKPFDFRFRIWDFAAPRDYSDYITVSSEPPPLDPLADAFTVLYDGGPGQVPVAVNMGPGYQLASLDEGAGFTQGVPFVGPAGANAYTLAIWHRHANLFPAVAGYFGIIADIAWEVKFNNDAVGAIAFLGMPITEFVDTMTGMWPQGDTGWHLTVLVRDYNGEVDPLPSVRLYIDGMFQSSCLIGGSAPLPSGPRTFQVGGWPPGFDATQATGAVWTRALSEAEIQLMYAATVFPP